MKTLFKRTLRFIDFALSIYTLGFAAYAAYKLIQGFVGDLLSVRNSSR